MFVVVQDKENVGKTVLESLCTIGKSICYVPPVWYSPRRNAPTQIMEHWSVLRTFSQQYGKCKYITKVLVFIVNREKRWDFVGVCLNGV